MLHDELIGGMFASNKKLVKKNKKPGYLLLYYKMPLAGRPNSGYNSEAVVLENCKKCTVNPQIAKIFILLIPPASFNFLFF
jgi:hypothetical protein